MTTRLAPSLLALITALVAMGVASMALYVPSLPAIQAEFGVATADTQRTLTLFFIGFAFGQLLIGPLSDKFGRKPVLILGLIVYGAISLACAFAWDIGALQVGRFLQGFAACAGPVVGRAMVRDLTGGGPGAGAAFAVVGTALAIVPAVAPMVGGLIQTHIGWRAGFVTLALLSLILFTICLARLRETLVERTSHAMHPRHLIGVYASLFRTPYFMGQALVSSLAFSGFFAYFTEAPFLFIGELGIGADTFGYLMVFTVIGYATGSFTAGSMMDRWGPRRTVLTGCGFLLAGATLLLLLSDTLSLARVIGPMSLYTIGFGMVIPGSMAEALRPFPRVAGSASAVLGFSQFLCAAGASLLVQPLYDGSAGTLSVLILLIAVTALAQFLYLTRNGHTLNGASGGHDHDRV